MSNNVYHELKKLDGIWRVDGIGEIPESNQTGNRISVHFSEIDPAKRYKPYSPSSITTNVYALKLTSAGLKEYKVGSLWQNGELVQPTQVIEDSISGKAESFRIDTHHAEHLTLCQPEMPGGFLIDSTGFRIGINLKPLESAYFVKVPVIRHSTCDFLLIPCSELIRFYFGVSSRFCRKVMDGSLQDLCDIDGSEIRNGTVSLRLKRPDLTRLERFVLSRAIASPDAMSALTLPHRFIAKARLENQQSGKPIRRVVPYAKFPFKGETTLHLAGKRRFKMTLADGSIEWGAFGMEILKCSYPNEFTAIEPIYVDCKPPSEPKEYRGNSGNVALPPQEEDDNIEINEDAGADARLAKIPQRDYHSRFGGYWSICLLPPDVEVDGVRQRANNTNLDDNGTFSIGEDNYKGENKGNRGVDQNSTEAQVNSRDLALFISMIDELRKLAKGKAEIRFVSFGSRLLFNDTPVETFPAVKGRSWFKVEIEAGDRARQLVCAEFTNSLGHVFYLFEMELRTNTRESHTTLLIHRKDFARLSSDVFKKYLGLTVRLRIWPVESQNWKSDKLGKYNSYAKQLFDEIVTERIDHPPHREPSNHALPEELEAHRKKKTEKWAKDFLKKLTAYGLIPIGI